MITEGLEKWVNLVNYIRNLPSRTVQQLLDALKIISNRARELDVVGFPYTSRFNDPTLFNAYNQIITIAPNLITTLPEYIPYQEVWEALTFNEAAEATDLIIEIIQHIYDTFGVRLAQRGLTLTPIRREEVMTISPAITYQPGDMLLH